jgi:uncharacterized SAM-binding protein YcdF (DUF218 family)
MRHPFTTIILIAIVSLLAGSSCTMKPFATRHLRKAKKEGPYDVIIVPGIPYIDTTSSGLLFTARVLWSKYLYDHGIAKNIIYSGAAVSTPYYEGRAMKIVADTLGIPPQHTFSEIKAEHSTENIWYGVKMARKLGFKKIAVASDGFQIALLRGFIRRRCGNPAVLPTLYDSLKIDRNHWQKYFPKVDFRCAYDSTYIRLSDRETFSERFRGTRGRHIHFDEKD